MIKNMDMVVIHGKTEENMKDSGLKVNNMVMVLIYNLIKLKPQTILKLNMVFGKWEEELNGYKMKQKLIKLNKKLNKPKILTQTQYKVIFQTNYNLIISTKTKVK